MRPASGTNILTNVAFAGNGFSRRGELGITSGSDLSIVSKRSTQHAGFTFLPRIYSMEVAKSCYVM